MQNNEFIKHVSGNLVVTVKQSDTNKNMVNVHLICKSCVFKNRGSGNYIVFDNAGHNVTKVLLYSKKTSKLHREIQLSNNDNHPTQVEYAMTQNISNKCSEYTPHIIHMHNGEIVENVDKLFVNDREVSFWNANDYYQKIAIMTVEQGNFALDEYIENNDISVDEFIEILFQVFYTLYAIRVNFPGFVHGDLLSQNIIMSENPDYNAKLSNFYEYQYSGESYQIPVRKYIPKIWDYEFSSSDDMINNFIENNHLGSKNDIYRLLVSLRYSIYAEEQKPITPTIDAYGTIAFEERNTPIKDEPRYKKINDKYLKLFNQFSFLTDNITNLFLMNDDNTIYVPTLMNAIRILSNVSQLRKYNIDKNDIVKHFPNLTTYTQNVLTTIKTTIKMIDFDFHDTLSVGSFSNYPFSGVSSGLFIDNRDANTLSWQQGEHLVFADANEIYNNIVELGLLFEYLIDILQIKICVISFGNKENIYELMSKAFGHKITDAIKIIGTDIQIPCDDKNSAKNEYIKKTYEENNLTPNDVLFFDDKLDNVICAKKLGINVFKNPMSGVTSEMIVNELNKYMLVGGLSLNNNYQHKYLKYKMKYLNLQKKH